MSDPHHDLGRDVGVAIAKTLPPVAIWSLTLNDVLATLSIAYVVLQITYLTWRWSGEFRRRGAQDAASPSQSPPPPKAPAG